MEQTKILYTVKEVAAILHTNPTYVYQLINSGLLPALKLGAFKIRHESLMNFISENENKDLRDPYDVKPLN